MVEIINGATKKQSTSNILKQYFEQRNDLDGILYIAFPILFVGEKSYTVDALWISPKYGVTIFDFIEDEQEYRGSEIRQDDIFSLIDGKLRTYPELRRGRKDFLVNIEIFGFAPNFKTGTGVITNFAEFTRTISQNLTSWNASHLFDSVLSILQSVIRLKKKETRTNVTKADSKGAKLINLEKNIAVLDRNQEKAVIEYFDGVQRIRGLAGSGKTIVLALKAAYLYSQNPDWTIAVTFNTRSLKQQFRDLITRFCIEKKGEEPDWQRIRIVNAWGRSKDKEFEKGIYYDFCTTNNIEFYDLTRAQSISAYDQSPFEVVCQKAIENVKATEGKYDAILVDEAQDLSESFLKLCFMFLKKDSKRLIYAYDELQKLNKGSSLRNPKEFLTAGEFDDQMLKVCYRNPRPLLVTAHGLGFGIYRNTEAERTNLVQFFDQPQLWYDVGYKIESGDLKSNVNVTLYRDEETSPSYLESHSKIDDLILFKEFDTKEAQCEWIANEIEHNIKEDELLYGDIVVVNPIATTTQKEIAIIRECLLKKGINNHIAGDVDADVFFKDESIAFTGINRAKGNEVAMIYIINAQDCYSGMVETRDLIRRRNILFTAITRSKAWVRVAGIGKNMTKLIKEYEKVKSKSFKLDFRYPTPEEIRLMNIIHRDISETELSQRKSEVKSLEAIFTILAKIKKGDAYIEDYPEEFQSALRELLDQ